MNEQQRLFNPDKLSSQQFDPVASVGQHAKKFAEGRGLTWKLPPPQQQADSIRVRAQGQAYKDAQASPEVPGIRASYESFRSHVLAQYAHLTKPESEGGMGFTHTVTAKDPYKTVQDMAADVREKRITTFATASTGLPSFLNEEENDKFRAVHDVFGHAASGRGFSTHGEEAAYRSHLPMFPKEAHAALWSETRGQTSYFYGGDEHDFPKQTPGKLVGPPKWAIETGPLKKKTPKIRTKGYEQGKLAI